MGWVRLMWVLLLLEHGQEGASLTVTSNSTGNFISGKDIRLEISYENISILAVSWSINNISRAVWYDQVNQKISDEYKNRTSFLDKGSLLIRNTSVKDEGIYNVKVTALNEIEGSKSFVVKFYDEILNVIVTPSVVNVSESTLSVRLQCNSSSGEGEVTWERDAQLLKTSNMSILSNGNKTLEIIQPNRNDSGNYTCIMSNPVSRGQGTWILNVTAAEPSNNSSQLSPGAIAGIVIGSVAGAALIILLVVLLVCCVQRRKGPQKEKNPAGPNHKNVLRTVSGTTLSPDDPAFFTVNNIMYRNASISMGSYILPPAESTRNSESLPSKSPSSPPKVKHATQV